MLTCVKKQNNSDKSELIDTKTSVELHELFKSLFIHAQSIKTKLKD